MVISWAVKVLTVSGVKLVVVFGALDIEVLHPSEFSIDIPLFGQFSVVWHAGSLDLILFIWVEMTLRLVHNVLFLTTGFAKQFLV